MSRDMTVRVTTRAVSDTRARPRAGLFGQTAGMVASNGFVLVTGGSRGIGAATARLAAERGSDVCISYRDRADSAEAVVTDCERIGVSALAVPADVSQEQDVLRLFATASDALGALGALVNNAGVLDRQARVVDLEAARIERILAVNVLGSFLCAREAVRRMSTRGGGAGGAIVNVSSRAAVLGGPGEYVDYAASKAAVDTLTIGLSREVADEGIRVNAVRPDSSSPTSMRAVVSRGGCSGCRSRCRCSEAARPRRLPRRSSGCSPTARPT